MIAAISVKAQDWSLAAYYRISSGDFAGVAMNKVATSDSFLGIKGLKPDVYGFAGVSTGGATLVGGALQFPIKIGEGLTLGVGPALDGDIMELKNVSLG